MIVKNFIVILMLSVALISNVSGSSYSNVYVGSEVVPREYYQYGTPYASLANPRLSQINSLPPIPSYLPPCGSPCVYPAQPVATLTPVNPNANVLTYSPPIPPSVPVVVTPTKEEATGYEYSYVVYDENTGDHKAQRELSDGSVVRGEYSFIQPDGYVREVQYVADDVSGFNAVVKNFLPVAIEGKKIFEIKENKESSPPCHEVKNESLRKGSEEESNESAKKHGLKIHEKQHKKESKKHSDEESGSKESTESKESKEESKEKHHGKSKKESGEEEESKEKHDKKSKKESGEGSEEKSQEKHHKTSKKESKENCSEESEEESKEKHLKKSKKGAKESKESGEESGEESESGESKEKSRKKSSKESKESEEESKENSKKKSKKGSKESSSEESEEESKEKLAYNKHKGAHELLKPEQEVLVPYNDILRCLQAAIRRSNEVPSAMREAPSPLTYIILNKPC